jgi:hypothetical protein
MFSAYKRFRIKYEVMRRILADRYHLDGFHKSEVEAEKRPIRTDIINFLVASIGKQEPWYLEIGVRDPAHNFDQIRASKKYSVDPGVEFSENPVDFKLTSDQFFDQLREGKILNRQVRFDVIFIDGLHTADQTDRDIENALAFISDGGYVVLHDCNPPTETHARETYDYWASPALDYWNGTTWKAFFRHRRRDDIYSCCVDSDWGIGILSKTKDLGAPSRVRNPFYEYSILENNRRESLNLISFEELKKRVSAAK